MNGIMVSLHYLRTIGAHKSGEKINNNKCVGYIIRTRLKCQYRKSKYEYIYLLSTHQLTAELVNLHDKLTDWLIRYYDRARLGIQQISSEMYVDEPTQRQIGCMISWLTDYLTV